MEIIDGLYILRSLNSRSDQASMNAHNNIYFELVFSISLSGSLGLDNMTSSKIQGLMYGYTCVRLEPESGKY